MKKRMFPIAAIASAVLLIGGCIAAFTLQPSLRYYAEDTVLGLFRKVDLTPVPAESLSLKSYTLEELSSLDSVRWDQSLMLINSDHPLPSHFTAEIVEYGTSGVLMNACVTDAYRALAADVAERFGEKLFIRSAYRTEEEQAAAMDSEGENAAGLGESEHQAGLALDVYVRYYAGMGFLDSPTGQYVNKSCQEHGFIIRYPHYGEKSTGIPFEPWHIRYVGHPHAEIMAEGRLTLEEYLVKLEESTFFESGDYLISVQSGDEVLLPESFISAVISPDNKGNFAITLQITDD